MKTLYDILEVSALAGKEAIDASYQRLLAGWQQPTDPAAGNQAENLRLDAIKRAYAVLSDPAKRAEYDARNRGYDAPRDRLHNQYSDGLLSEFLSFARKPLLFFLAVLVPILTVSYMIANHKIKSGSLAVSERSDLRDNDRKTAEAAADEKTANQGLAIVDKSVEYNNELEKQRLELENERLRLQHEALRLEQARRDRELEYQARANDRSLKMEERKLDTSESEMHAERRHTDDRYQDEKLQRSVTNMQNAVELLKDAKAAQLGLTREQYDRLRQEPSGYRPTDSH